MHPLERFDKAIFILLVIFGPHRHAQEIARNWLSWSKAGDMSEQLQCGRIDRIFGIELLITESKGPSHMLDMPRGVRTTFLLQGRVLEWTHPVQGQQVLLRNPEAALLVGMKIRTSHRQRKREI